MADLPPVTIAEGSPDDPERPHPVSRRGFLGRASAGALTAFAFVAGAPGIARARPEPPPCAIRCRPISQTGCACGGHLYRCTGCRTAFHACVDGAPFEWICLRRHC
jgi:hypothetical protein